MHPLASTLVRITTRNGCSFSGCRISQTHILTAAGQAGIEEPLRIDFPLITPGITLAARIHFLDPNQGVAILEITSSEAPDGVWVPLDFSLPANLIGKSLQTYGFTVDQGAGKWIDGTVIEPAGPHRFRLALPAEAGFEPGGCAAPAWDETGELLVGIVSLDQTGQPVLLTAEFIANAWPDYLDNLFETVQHQRQALPGSNSLEPTLHSIPPVLNQPWKSFSSDQPWHRGITPIVSRILSSAGDFTELSELVQRIQQVDQAAGYDDLLASLRALLAYASTPQVAGVINTTSIRLERELGLTAVQIHHITRPLDESETRLLRLDQLRQNLADLRRAIAAPHFNRCFLVTGDHASDLTPFINWVQASTFNRSRKPGSNRLELFPLFIKPLTPEDHGPSKVRSYLDETLRPALVEQTGLGWSGLDSFGAFLDLYNRQARSRLEVRLILLLDDLSQWHRNWPGIVETLIARIKAGPHSASVYYVITMPIDFYPQLAASTGPDRDFWRRYGPELDPLGAVDGWLVLDNPEPEHSYLRELEAFGKNQETHLLAQPLNRLSAEPLQPVELRGYLHLIARLLAATPGSAGSQLSREALLASVTDGARQAPGPVHALARLERASFALDLLLSGGFPGLAPLGTGHELVMAFPEFWEYLLARELYTRQQKEPIQRQALETWIRRISPDLAPGTLSLFLLMVEAGSSAPDRFIHYSQMLLQSSSLLHASVWKAGLRSGAANRQAVLDQARQDLARHTPGQPQSELDRRELCALLRFLDGLPSSLLSPGAALALLQPFYAPLASFHLQGFFIYLVRHWMVRITHTDDLTPVLTALSGCEPMALTEELAVMAAARLAELTSPRPDPVLLALGEPAPRPDDQELLNVLLAYLSCIRHEDPDPHKIPGQERGWSRFLFREWMMATCFERIVADLRLGTYDFLCRNHWYNRIDLRENRCLVRQMEQEANIAIGRLFRAPRMREEFISMVARLSTSENLIDRRNAFHIIRHSAPAGENEHEAHINPVFHPILEKLFLDPTLTGLVTIPLFNRIFRQLKNFTELEARRRQG